MIQRMISNTQIDKVDAFHNDTWSNFIRNKNIENVLPDDLKMAIKYDLENIFKII